MAQSAKGRVDANIDETRATIQALENTMAANDETHLLFAYLIFFRETGEFLGSTGVWSPSRWFGWPEIAYSVKIEAWGKGYATEAVNALVGAWWGMPRREVEGLEVDGRSVVAGEENGEVLTAMVEADNAASRRVMEKCGWIQFREWTNVDDRSGREGTEVPLVGYRISKPRKV